MGWVKLTHLLQLARTSGAAQVVGGITKSVSAVQQEQLEEFVELAARPKQAHCWLLRGVLEVVRLKKNLLTQSHLRVPLVKFVALVVALAVMFSHLQEVASRPTGHLGLCCE